MGKVVHTSRVSGKGKRYVVYGIGMFGRNVEHGRFDKLSLATALCKELANKNRDQTFWVEDTLED